MRCFPCLSLLLMVVSLSPAGEAEEVVAKAIRAHAEKPERLESLKAIRTLAKGTMRSAQGENKAVRDMQLQWPDTLYMKIDISFGAATVPVINVMEGNRGWMKAAKEKVVEMGREEIVDNGQFIHAAWLSLLKPLGGKSVKLVSVNELKLPAGPASGVRVSAEGKPDVLMYFDNKSGLLTKMAYTGREAGVKMLRELDFAKYREVSGIKLPFEELESRDGKPLHSWQIEDIKIMDRIEPALLKQ